MPGGTHDLGPPGLPGFRLRGSHPLRRPVPAAFGQPDIPWRRLCRALRPTRPTPDRHRRQPVPPVRFGLPPFRSPLLRGSSLFLRVLRCFSSPGAPPASGVPAQAAGGLPHSDTPGSQAASASPGRFAAWPRPSSAASAKASPVRPSSRPCRVRLARSRPSGPARAERPSAADGTSGSVSPSVLLWYLGVDGVCSARGRARQRPGPNRRQTAGRVVRPSTAAGRGRPAHRIVKVPKVFAAVAGGEKWFGGAAGIRTPDLRHAKAALSRLSYGPPSDKFPRPARSIPCPEMISPGGRAWTRTRDLGLIRAAL